MKKIKYLIFIFILLTFNFKLSTIAGAQSAEGLSAIPPRLEITVKPDGVNSQTIKVRNESSVEKNITVSIEDFVVNDDKGTPTIISATKEDNRWAASN
jgi:ABC-type oligopeptide transport system substrate-binding subunit